MPKYVFDTNGLLENPELLELEGEKIIPYVVLKELDKLKMGKNETAYQAREAVRKIKNIEKELIFDSNFENSDYLNNNDDVILACAEKNKAIIVTGDLIVQIKAKAKNMDYLDLELNKDDEIKNYTGVKELILPDYKLASIYEYPKLNILDMKENEYLLVKNDKGEYVDKFKWSKGEFSKVKGYKIRTRYFGDIVPKNQRQELLFDLLQNDDIKIKKCTGYAGSGKDFLFVTHAMHMLEQGKKDRIIFCRNQIELEGSPSSGYRKGDNFDKMIEFAMPLADHVGGVDELRLMVEKGVVELQDISRMRGRDISNSIIIVSEFQNNLASHAKMLIGRIAENTQLWINGDIRQVDNKMFSVNNGLKALSKLAGQDLYGEVFLDKTERSKAAELSEFI